MFDFAKTVVCGVVKGAVATLAVVGGALVTCIVTDDNFAKGLIDLCSDGVTSEKSEGD